MADNNRTCSIPECGKPFKARGWCNSHWYRWYRHGDPLFEPPAKDVVHCSVEDCRSIVAARGLCKKHHGVREGRPECSIRGCDNLAQARGWCATHYTRWRKTGSLDIAPIGPALPCSVFGCSDGARTKGYCKRHYGRFSRTGNAGEADFRRTVSPVLDGRKQCFTCEEWKLLAEFNKHPQGRGGVGSSCRLCLSVKSREWFAANPGYRKAWNAANAERKLSDVHRRRARRTDPGAEVIDRREVFEDDGFTCQLCGTPMDMGAKAPQPLAPTLDHIVPISKGGTHTRENVASAHFHCNVSKGNRERPLTAPATA